MARFGYFPCAVTAWKHVRTTADILAQFWRPIKSQRYLQQATHSCCLRQLSHQLNGLTDDPCPYVDMSTEGQARAVHISPLHFLQNLCLLRKPRTRRHRQVEPTVTWSAPRAQAGKDLKESMSAVGVAKLWISLSCNIIKATNIRGTAAGCGPEALGQKPTGCFLQAGRRTDRQTDMYPGILYF